MLASLQFSVGCCAARRTGRGSSWRRSRTSWSRSCRTRSWPPSSSRQAKRGRHLSSPPKLLLISFGNAAGRRSEVGPPLKGRRSCRGRVCPRPHLPRFVSFLRSGENQNTWMQPTNVCLFCGGYPVSRALLFTRRSMRPALDVSQLLFLGSLFLCRVTNRTGI